MDERGVRPIERIDEASDQDLLDRLREGDDRAYEVLWIRHVAAARRVASRISPNDADDLVSESFLAVYHQVRHLGNGPRTAFRAYLFTVIRNTAARWHQQRRLVLQADFDAVVEDEGARQLEGEHDARMLLDAFRALPERWQRVLWLSDVEGASRSVIAAELGIRPNAVSNLRRRATRGLRAEWLVQHVPAALRDDPDHIGGVLPLLVTGDLPADEREAARTHLASCDPCRRVLEDVWDARKRDRRAGLPVGLLGAVGVTIPAVSTAWAAVPVGVASATLLAGAAAVCSAVVIAGALGLGAVPDAGGAPQPSPTSHAPPPAPVSAEPPPAPVSQPVSETPVPTPVPVTPSEPPPDVDDLPPIDFGPSLPGDGPRVPSTPPMVQPVTVVVTPGAEPAPEVVTTYPTSAFLAPVLTGSVPVGDAVVVQVLDQVYPADVDDAGAWSFDLRAFPLAPGDHTAEVWSVAPVGTASLAQTVDFTIEGLVHNWFDEYMSLTLRESSSDGFVFTVAGPPDGAVCVWSDNGQTAVMPLDERGETSRRIRFWGYGIYALNLYPCVDGVDGPWVQRNVSIREGMFDPWGLDIPEWTLDEP